VAIVHRTGSWGHFPNQVAQNHEFLHTAIGKNPYRLPIAVFLVKMAFSKNLFIRVTAGDLRPDHTVICQNEKNPCFGGEVV
jgi:hypothetical protein